MLKSENTLLLSSYHSSSPSSVFPALGRGTIMSSNLILKFWRLSGYLSFSLLRLPMAPKSYTFFFKSLLYLLNPSAFSQPRCLRSRHHWFLSALPPQPLIWLTCCHSYIFLVQIRWSPASRSDTWSPDPCLRPPLFKMPPLCNHFSPAGLPGMFLETFFCCVIIALDERWERWKVGSINCPFEIYFKQLSEKSSTSLWFWVNL